MIINSSLTHPILSAPAPLRILQPGYALGDGPKRETMRALIQVVTSDETIFKNVSHEGGFKTLGFIEDASRDLVRGSKIRTAGICAALHLVVTGTSPFPLAPALLYLALQEDYKQLVSRRFIQCIEPEVADWFFPLLVQAEAIFANTNGLILQPFRDFFLHFRSREVCIIPQRTFFLTEVH
jgi:hypothetical protein